MEFAKVAPNFEHALDKSINETGIALSNALNFVDRKTRRERLDLPNGYRSLLQSQTAFADDSMKEIIF